MKNIYLLVISALLYACQNENNIKIDNPTVFFNELITKEKKAIFKNVNFDFSIDDVKKTENAQLYEATKEHLFYSYNFPKDSSVFIEYVDIKYFFDETNTLKIISANIFLNDSIQEQHLLDNFREYYTIKYGDSKVDDYQYDTWEATADSKNKKGKYYYNIAIKKMKGEYGIMVELLRL